MVFQAVDVRCSVAIALTRCRPLLYKYGIKRPMLHDRIGDTLAASLQFEVNRSPLPIDPTGSYCSTSAFVPSLSSVTIQRDLLK